MYRYLNFIVSAFLCVMLFSCSETDTTKPFAELISPADADSFLINDTIIFNAAFSDNEELGQYHLEVKNNFIEIQDSLPAWKFVLVDVISGSQDTITHELIIPDTIYKGNYFMIIKCTDVEGNEAPADTSQIVIH